MAKLEKEINAFKDRYDPSRRMSAEKEIKDNKPTVKRNRQQENIRKLSRKPGVRLAKPAVVVIANKPESNLTYAEILGKAKEIIVPEDLGIERMRMRRAVNGAIVLEIPEPKGRQLASNLRSNLQEVLKDDAKVSNPVATGVLRLRGIDLDTTEDQVKSKVEEISGCRHDEIKINNTSTMRDGMRAAWVECPNAQYSVIDAGDSGMFGPIVDQRSIVLVVVLDVARQDILRIVVLPKCAVCMEMKKEHSHRLGSPVCLENQGFHGSTVNLRKVQQLSNKQT
ncbi:uncharacterized protein LOC114933369 [Nylanderia fulva]|uniref:uncharacterized protein LOC114933369 n=1 Tax=Nylanderia fulva TaxID=613905 RepID=UPI0010FB12C2|nr:uncharacterized protein LOC114933369 [Nylanderia fulva]